MEQTNIKPSFTKKAQAILKKELGSDIEVKKTYDGAVLKASGKSHGINMWWLRNGHWSCCKNRNC